MTFLRFASTYGHNDKIKSNINDKNKDENEYDNGDDDDDINNSSCKTNYNDGNNDIDINNVVYVARSFIK